MQSKPIKIYPSWLEAISQTCIAIFCEGKTADKEIPALLKRQQKWGSRDRKFVAESLYEIVRWWRLLDYQISGNEKYTPQNDKDYWLQIFRAYLRKQDYKVLNPEIFEGLEEIKNYNTENPAIIASYPDDFYQKALKEIGEAWHATASRLNEKAPVYIRVNTLVMTFGRMLELLKKEGIEATPTEVPQCIRIESSNQLQQSKWYKDGAFEFQDKGSQMIGHFCDIKPGMVLADVCAGVGGKTLQLAALMNNQGKIIASDISGKRLERLSQRAHSAKVSNVKIIPSEAFESFAPKTDRLLLDVPCSGTGVIRRQADTKWKFSLKNLKELLVIQQDLLEKFSKNVKPGGKLIYATCSILPSESEDQIENFLKKHAKDWQKEAEIRLSPGETDGFYMARLVRKITQ
jgi:16S rRNA (cytosine967-C5)-methyltransferase